MESVPLPMELLEMLACPACEERPPLRWQEGALVCDQCGRRYPIREGIPVLLTEEAEPPPIQPAQADASQEAVQRKRT